ncbi:MAG: hypothetical protein KAZ30_00240 [Candidatus Magasanikbacteria bacterium]|nr:hypothetical protein [Candidatus Magasanikbacteria bacterium]
MISVQSQDKAAKRQEMRHTIDLLLRAEQEMQIIRTEMKRLRVEEQNFSDKEELHNILQKISQFK